MDYFLCDFTADCGHQEPEKERAADGVEVEDADIESQSVRRVAGDEYGARVSESAQLMPWVLYRQRKLEIEAELRSEMRSFVAKAFDGKNMGVWSKQKHKNARRTMLILASVARGGQRVRGKREEVKKGSGRRGFRKI